MKKWVALFSIAVVLLAAGCGKQEETQATPSAEMTVFAAASLTDVMQELAETYEADHPGVKIIFNFASSGALQTQIEQGAPCDLFASAGKKQVDTLVEKGFIEPESVQLFAYNRLVAVTPKDSPVKAESLEDLLQPEIRQIGIGDPGSVPAGQYSMEVLTNRELADELQDKLVYANNVRQVLQYVEQGEVELGFVYATDAAMSEGVTVSFTVPEADHQPITYPICVMKESAQGELAAEFAQWVLSEAGQKVLEEYGFTPAQ